MKHNIAKWLLILLFYVQYCSSEEPPGPNIENSLLNSDLEDTTIFPTSTEASKISNAKKSLQNESDLLSTDDSDKITESDSKGEENHATKPSTHSNINKEQDELKSNDVLDPLKNEANDSVSETSLLKRFGVADFGSRPAPTVVKLNPVAAFTNLRNSDFGNLDTWRPVWPYSKQTTVIFRPTVKFPSDTPSIRTPRPTVRFPDAVSKEPVTAYYFDVLSSTNLPAPGPLHDITNLAGSFGIPNKLKSPVFHDATPTLHHTPTSMVSSTKLPDTIDREGLIENDYNVNLRGEVLATPTYPNTETDQSYSLGSPSDFQFDNIPSEKHLDIESSTLESSSLFYDNQAGDSLEISSTIIPSEPSHNSISFSESLVDLKSTPIVHLSSVSLGTRVPLWMRLSNKKSSIIDTFIINSTPVVREMHSINSLNDNDIPLGILSAGLPVVIEPSSPQYTATSDLPSEIDASKFSRTKVDKSFTMIPVPVYITPDAKEEISPSTTTTSVEGVPDHTAKSPTPKTLINNSIDENILDEDLIRPAGRFNSIPEPKKKSPQITIPSKTNDWMPLVNETSISSTSLSPTASDINTSVQPTPTDIVRNFTPIALSTVTLSLHSNIPSKAEKQSITPASTFRAPLNSTLYIVKNGDQITIPATEPSIREPVQTATTPEVFANVDDTSEMPVEASESNVDPAIATEEGKDFDVSANNESLNTTTERIDGADYTDVKETSTTEIASTTTEEIHLTNENVATTVSSLSTLDSGSTMESSIPSTTNSTVTPISSTTSTTASTSTTSSTTTPASATSTSTTSTSTTSTSSSTTSTSTSTTSTSEVTSTIDETSESSTTRVDDENFKLQQTDEMLANGTAPFVRAAFDFGSEEFCRHRNNIRNLLHEWGNNGLRNKSERYEIEIFRQPNCDAPDASSESITSAENRTNLYFYIKQNGIISPPLTVEYPRNLSTYELSKELQYLREKIIQLELINAISEEDRILEEAQVNKSILIVTIVSVILVIAILSLVLGFLVVKRRRSAEHLHGRRCTPAANDAYSMDSVSVYYHSFKRKNKKRNSNKSIKSYLNQGFEDPNGPSHLLNFAKLTHFISDNEGIQGEFFTIPSVPANYDDMPAGCEEKNRYANVIPVLETRIILRNNRKNACEEYINANALHGPRGEQRYFIATQAPLDETVDDFWQMVWEQESRVIVMLTDFIENGIEKCADYLPPSETLDCHRVYGDFQVTLKSRDMRDQYIESHVQLKNLENNLVREICHMWYTGWPHAGVPNAENTYITFIFDVRTARKKLRSKGPIVVHCSPGTGRTGTFIACDILMRNFDDQKMIDVPKTVYKIRRERAGAVQTKEQYAFIYRVANLYAAKLTTGNLDSF